ncbi:MAG: hypothetical protein HYV59_04800 [Planctomycetes bacterium]|nr:hypothetical protein [Planctomycetota bacterium]
MAEKDISPEEQKLRVRRRLLKLAIYSIPAIATIRAAEDANADGDDVDDYYEEHGSGSGSGSGGGGKVPKKKFRKTPQGKKKYKQGLS